MNLFKVQLVQGSISSRFKIVQGSKGRTLSGVEVQGSIASR